MLAFVGARHAGDFVFARMAGSNCVAGSATWKYASGKADLRRKILSACFVAEYSGIEC